MATLDLVFEGGGAKGVAFAGALEALAAHGHRPGRLVGTSAGAIAAALCAAGYSPAEMLAALSEERDGRPRFLDFFDTPGPRDFPFEVRSRSLLARALRRIDVPGIPAVIEDDLDRMLLTGLLGQAAFARLFSLIECGGLYLGEALRGWVEEKLEAKGIPGSTTLHEFHRITGADLTVVAADPQDRELLALNHRTAPGLPVAAAVRMSAGIPFLWRPLQWRSRWGRYLGRSKAGHGIVDGGLLSNFPLRLLVEDSPLVRAATGGAPPDPERCLGLLLDETLPVHGAGAVGSQETFWEEVPLFRQACDLIAMLTEAWDRPALGRFERLVCRLPAKGYGTLEFAMDAERRGKLLAAARAAVAAHLEARAPELERAA